MKPIQKYLGAYAFFVVPTVVVIGIVILSLTLLFPTITSILDKRETLKSKQTELTQLTEKRTLLESFDTAYLPLLKEAELAVPSEKDAAGILITLDNLATTTSTGIDSISLDPGLVSSDSASTGPGAAANPLSGVVQVLPVSTTISADIDKFSDFLNKVQNSRRLFDITSLTLNFVPQTNVLQANMLLNSYYVPPPALLGAASAVLPNLTSAEKTALQKVATFPDLTALAQSSTSGSLSAQPLGKTDLFSP